MKHFVPLLLVSICLMLTPCAAYAQNSPDATAQPDAQSTPTPVQPDAQPSPDAQSTPTPVQPDAQPSPVAKPTPAGKTKTSGSVGPTVITLPPVPNIELFGSLGTDTTATVGSTCLGCVQPLGRSVGAFADVASAATQTVARTGVDTRFAFETGFAIGFKRIHDFRLVAEFPVLFNPNGDVKSGNLALARSYSSLFFTPALRIMYGPNRDTHPGYLPLYPWFSLGGGLAHYSPSAISLAGGVSGARNSIEGALQFGVGVDYGIYRRAIALRAEFRDIYADPPNLGVTGINLRHNLFAGGGIVFRFCKKCWAGRSSDQTSRTSSLAHN
jgi:hypothetical protein